MCFNYKFDKKSIHYKTKSTLLELMNESLLCCTLVKQRQYNIRETHY